MRLLGRNSYKLLTVLAICVIILIICLNYFTNIADEYITILDPEEQLQIHNSSAAQLLNLTNFSYLLENNICNEYNKELLAVIIVTSYVEHDELRSAHRRAISQDKLKEMGMQRVFLLAAIPSLAHFITQKQLQNEQKRFGDLLQGNFMEAYRNLSYKHTMGLRWAANDCKQAKFVVKIDDDIVYDVFQLKSYLESVELKESSLATSANFLAGFIIESKPPIRNQANKWFVSLSEYPANMYPAYLSGWLYITNEATALRLVHDAQLANFFWIDDTWVTGILRDRLNIPMQRLNPWYTTFPEYIDCCVRDLKQFSYECEYYVAPNGGDARLLVDFIHNVEKCYFDECGKRPQNKTLKETCVGTVKHIVPEHGEAIVHAIKLR